MRCHARAELILRRWTLSGQLATQVGSGNSRTVALQPDEHAGRKRTEIHCAGVTVMGAERAGAALGG
jgi:hypothetical protein